MTQHSKHLLLDNAALARSLATLQDGSKNPYYCQQAAQQAYDILHPYAEQQADAFAVRAAALDIERDDLVQSNALKLWQYLNDPARTEVAQTVEVLRRNVYGLLRRNMQDTLEAGSGAVVVKDDPEGTMGQLYQYLRYDGLRARLDKYKHNARKVPLPLEAVCPAFAKTSETDEDGIFDGVFDTPLKGAAECVADALPGPDVEVDLIRQRGLVDAFAKARLTESEYSIISRRYGLHDPRNQAMTQ